MPVELHPVVAMAAAALNMSVNTFMCEAAELYTRSAKEKTIEKLKSQLKTLEEK